MWNSILNRGRNKMRFNITVTDLDACSKKSIGKKMLINSQNKANLNNTKRVTTESEGYQS